MVAYSNTRNSLNYLQENTFFNWYQKQSVFLFLLVRILFHCEIIYKLVKCLIGNVAQMVKQACNIDYGRGVGEGADLVQHYDKQKKICSLPHLLWTQCYEFVLCNLSNFFRKKIEMYCQTRAEFLDKQGKYVTVFPITDSTYFITCWTVIRPMPFNIISCTSINLACPLY